MIVKLLILIFISQSVFALESNESVSINTKLILKDFDIKIEYYEGLLIEAEKKFAYLEKDTENKNINTLISLNKNIEEYKNKILAIKLERSNKEAQLKNLEHTLKFVNLNNTDEDYKLAVKLFKEGKINESLAILDTKKLNKNKIDLINAQKKHSNDWLLRANVLMYNKDFDQALFAFKQSLDTIETFSNTFSYANFLENQNKLAKSEIYYNKAKNLQTSNYEYATILNSLGNLYFKTNRYVKAEKYYLASLQIFKKLIKLNKEIYLPEIAIVLNNVGNLYYQNNKLDRAKVTYNQVLGIYEDLNGKYFGKYDSDIAMALNNMGNLYHKENDIDNAKKAYQKALKIRDELAKNNPIHNVELAMVLNNIGSLYYNLSFNNEAEESFKKAYNIIKKLAQINHEVYDLELAMAANNLATLYNQMDKIKESESFHLEALSIYEKYAKVNPEAFNYQKGVSLNNLALLYEKLNEKTQATDYYIKALKIREELAQKNKEAYGIDLARTKISYGFFLGGDYGEILINEAISLLKTYKDVHTASKLIEVGESMLKRLIIRR